MKSWFRSAVQPAVVRRALLYAVIVGPILVMINHGDALVRGEVDLLRVLKMGLTVVVPYMVSTSSSVGAMRQAEEDEGSPE